MFQPAPASAFSVAGLAGIDTTGTTFNRIFSQQAFSFAVNIVRKNVIILVLSTVKILLKNISFFFARLAQSIARNMERLRYIKTEPRLLLRPTFPPSNDMILFVTLVTTRCFPELLSAVTQPCGAVFSTNVPDKNSTRRTLPFARCRHKLL